jgi:D-alanyl-D-alanine carboxypeptidase
MPSSEIISETWCVMDSKTGQILIGGNENAKRRVFLYCSA